MKTLGIVPLCCLLSFAALSVDAREYELHASGWPGWTPGKGTFGPFVQDQFANLTEFDGSSFCDFDPESGVPSGALLTYTSLWSLLRTETGELLYRSMSNSPPSTLCFNFIDQTFHGEIYLDVVGGTGRFENATGSAVQTITGEIFGPTNSAFISERGEIDWVAGDD